MDVQRKSQPRWAAATVAIAVLLGIAGGAVYLLPRIGLEASLVWGSILAGLGWMIRAQSEKKAEYQRLLAEEKRNLYFEFLEFFVKAMESGDSGAEIDLSKESVRRFSLRLNLIASDEVCRCFRRIRLPNEITSTVTPGDTLRNWGLLMLAMRKDCGLSDTSLKPSEILSATVNDIHKYADEVDFAVKPSAFAIGDRSVSSMNGADRDRTGNP